MTFSVMKVAVKGEVEFVPVLEGDLTIRGVQNIGTLQDGLLVLLPFPPYSLGSEK